MLLEILGISLQQLLTGILTVVQIVFYTGTGFIVYLTYQNAKKGLLSPAYTEYHKQVIGRLKEISEELDSEFDPTSEKYWAYQQPMKVIVDEINAQFLADKKAIREKGEWRVPSAKLSPRYSRAKDLARTVRADPFIPEHIRKNITAMLTARANALLDAEQAAIHQYRQELAKGKGGVNFNPDNLEHNWTYVLGLVGDKLTPMGFSEAQTEEKVDEIRLQIQKYLQEFSPSRESNRS